MNFFLDIAGALAWRRRALRALAARGNAVTGVVLFGIGFMIFSLVRNYVYAELTESVILETGIWGRFARLNLLQAVLFVCVVYVPAIIALANAFGGDGLGWAVSRQEYRADLGVLGPLWGALLVVAAPLQVAFPQFLVIGVFGISIGLLALIVLLAAYTVWAIKELHYVPPVAAFGAFVLSWFTLPVFYVLTSFVFALPLFILIPVFYLLMQRLQAAVRGRAGQKDLQRFLQTLTVNPRDADALYQLGLIQLKRGNAGAAGEYFQRAIKIDAANPDYRYHLGRAFELREDWPNALDSYAEVYRMNPQYGLGDIFREVGKGYLHTGNPQKAIEFLRFFLTERQSDPEGRYWLAVALRDVGEQQEMRTQLRTILDQTRSNPRYFTRENRRWIFLARTMLRQ
jgi:tetratricopeptide (TPR) repeat protein